MPYESTTREPPMPYDFMTDKRTANECDQGDDDLINNINKIQSIIDKGENLRQNCFHVKYTGYLFPKF